MQVLSIDGRSTDGWDGDRAAKVLRGSQGSSVSVRFGRRPSQLVPGVAGRAEADKRKTEYRQVGWLLGSGFRDLKSRAEVQHAWLHQPCQLRCLLCCPSLCTPGSLRSARPRHASPPALAWERLAQPRGCTLGAQHGCEPCVPPWLTEACCGRAGQAAARAPGAEPGVQHGP